MMNASIGMTETFGVETRQARIANPYRQSMLAFLADIRSLHWSFPFVVSVIQLVVLLALVLLCGDSTADPIRWDTRPLRKARSVHPILPRAPKRPKPPKRRRVASSFAIFQNLSIPWSHSQARI
jgi:hypothetical protein